MKPTELRVCVPTLPQKLHDIIYIENIICYEYDNDDEMLIVTVAVIS